MATFNPQQYVGQNIGFGSSQLGQLQQQYGLTSQQLQSLRGGQAGQATPTLRLGNTPYNLTMGAGGGSYMVTAPKPAPIAPVSAPGRTSVSTSGPVGGPGANTPGTGTNATIQSSFRDALIGQMQTNPNAVSLSDPDLAPQARAYADQQQRAAERLQQDLAEQGFQGGAAGTGAYDQELANVRQQQGEAQAQYNAGLLGTARNQRVQNLLASLGIGQDYLTAQGAQNVQSSLGQSDIALRSRLGQGQLGLGLLQAMLQDRQTNNRLGLDAALAGAGLNQNALLAMLR
jgi:hypothetical protein